MNTTDGVAESSSQAVENYSDMATSAEATVEAQENALASFDQINKLADNSSSSDTNASPVVGTLSGNTISTTVDVDTSDADKKLKDFFYWVKSSFNTIFTPFKQAWDKNGVKVTDSMRFAFEGVWSVIKSIGGSFTDVWSNGTGEQISEHLLGIWTNINNTIGYVSRNFSSAWSDSSGTKIIQDILDIFNDILDTIENITADTVEWAQNIDFSPLITSFENVTSALKPLTADIFDGIEWFWDNILLPMASWTISTLIPTFLNLLAAAIKVLDSAISALKPMGKWLWDKFLKPIATWTGGIIVGALKGITSALNGVSDWIKNHQTAVENFAVVVGTLGSAFAISGIIQGVVSAFAALAARNKCIDTVNYCTWCSS